MKIGFVGLGKLGMPCAVAMAHAGHDVIGYDVNPQCMSKEPRPYRETGPDGTGDFNVWLANSSIRFGTLAHIANHAEIIFVAVQTPHKPEFEGVTPLPEERADFDYTYLRTVIAALSDVVNRDTVIAVISTVLPGTMRREVIPLLNEHMRLVYNPYFIAMGTVWRDFLNPEFVLLGGDDKHAAGALAEFYMDTLSRIPPPGWQMHSDLRRPFFGYHKIQQTAIESAELTKVAYNTFIGFKIAFANLLGEICHKIPEADVDEVTGALSQARERLISGKYLSAGMGDGGGCHPRDNIAMSWLARELNLHHDIFDSLMTARDFHAIELSRLLLRWARANNLPILIAGYAYKPETDIVTGSHALLVRDWLRSSRTRKKIDMFDPFIDTGRTDAFDEPAVILIGCKHAIFADTKFAQGSVVIDPFRYIPDQQGVEVIRIGERDKRADALRDLQRLDQEFDAAD